MSHKTSTAAPRDAIVLTLLNACCNFIKIEFYEVVRFRDGFIIGRVFVCDALLNRSSLWRLLRVFRVTDDNAGGASSKKNLTFPSANQAICRNNLLAICFDFTVYIYIYIYCNFDWACLPALNFDSYMAPLTTIKIRLLTFQACLRDKTLMHKDMNQPAASTLSNHIGAFSEIDNDSSKNFFAHI